MKWSWRVSLIHKAVICGSILTRKAIVSNWGASASEMPSSARWTVWLSFSWRMVRRSSKTFMKATTKFLKLTLSTPNAQD
ncbi:hypothetical protein D3C78_1775920 [compost metagenome]